MWNMWYVAIAVGFVSAALFAAKFIIWITNRKREDFFRWFDRDVLGDGIMLAAMIVGIAFIFSATYCVGVSVRATNEISVFERQKEYAERVFKEGAEYHRIAIVDESIEWNEWLYKSVNEATVLEKWSVYGSDGIMGKLMELEPIIIDGGND